jgi:hypothetical protein
MDGWTEARFGALPRACLIYHFAIAHFICHSAIDHFTNPGATEQWKSNLRMANDKWPMANGKWQMEMAKWSNGK